MLLQRAWRQISAESRRGEERRGGAKSSDCTHGATGSRSRIEGREKVDISITRSAWKRLTQRRARCAGIGVLYQTALHGSHASRTYLTGIKSTTTRSASYARRLLFPLVPTTPFSLCAAPLQSDIYRFQLLSWLRLSGRDRHCVSTIGVGDRWWSRIFVFSFRI